MVRYKRMFRKIPAGSPHACGDGPKEVFQPYILTSFSPRVWGWSGIRKRQLYCPGVLPTRVGMVRVRDHGAVRIEGSPHACGDGPTTLRYTHPGLAFSPRVWGWSALQVFKPSCVAVLPTRVGMVRSCGRLRMILGSSPHACGDGPLLKTSAEATPGFSPRVWGWSAQQGQSRQ